MAIKKYTGVLNTIEGQQGQVGNRVAKWYKLAILEIGGTMLQNLVVSERFVIFLKAGNEMTLYIDGKSIIALERSDGKLFVANHAKPGMLSLIVGIALIPLYGVGLLALYMRHMGARRFAEIEDIVAQYPSYENLRG